jgi:glycosyltransferase involved in cell wall biosynthesis
VNIFLENINLKSNSGPNYFAQKLVKYLELRGVLFDSKMDYSKKLTFIQSTGVRDDLPMILRLDGIYFNSNFDCERMNYNIKKSYEKAKGIVFQTEFNKELIFSWFGLHDNYTVIPNGADTVFLNELETCKEMEQEYSKYNSVWSCAADWHSYKRLKENIEYFLIFSKPDDILLIAGKNPDYQIQHPRVRYLGNLNIKQLITMYKISEYFIHLAYLDHCPNVVVDARACGCKIICSSSGGTKEIAGFDAIIIKENKWDYSLIKKKEPPFIDFDQRKKNQSYINPSMVQVAKRYYNFLKETK